MLGQQDHWGPCTQKTRDLQAFRFTSKKIWTLPGSASVHPGQLRTKHPRPLGRQPFALLQGALSYLTTSHHYAISRSEIRPFVQTCANNIRFSSTIGMKRLTSIFRSLLQDIIPWLPQLPVLVVNLAKLRFGFETFQTQTALRGSSMPWSSKVFSKTCAEIC